MAKSSFNSSMAMKQLLNALEEKRKEAKKAMIPALNNIGKELTDKIKQFVWWRFYETYPESERTNRLGEDGGFLGTISYKVNEANLSVEIYCDWDKLYIEPDQNDSKFPHHYDAYTGEAFVEELYDYIYYGKWPYSYKPRPIIKGFKGISKDLQRQLNQMINNYVLKEMNKALRAAGINGKIVNKNLTQR